MRGSRVAIIGANGQLGTDLVEAFQDWDVVPLTHAEIEICDHTQTRQVLESIRPDVVVNTAAFVRVDDCEDEIGKAFSVNAFAVRNLAQVCAALDSTLVQISTDYVLDGKKGEPYTEEDLPNPINVYGASKLAGEHFVQAICPKHLIVRTSGLYGKAGSSGKGGNFVETMLRLAKEGKRIRVVDDQVLAPTLAKDLACAIVDLTERAVRGTYHVTNSGACSWHEFAARILTLERLRADLAPVSTAQFAATAKRPAYSVLSNGKLEMTGIRRLPPWEEALAGYLGERRAS